MIERVGLAEWIAFDAAHPAPTFFARPAWSLALAQANPELEPGAVRVQSGADPWILIPMVRSTGRGLRWRQYSGFPLGGYTCFLTDDGGLATQPQAQRALAELHRWADHATLIPWPLAPAPAARNCRAHSTAVVDLSNGLDAAMAGVAGIFRRMAGQAERRGVACEVSHEPDAVDRYYDLLEASAQRWGLAQPPIAKALIASLVHLGGNDVEIWFARAQDRDIGGGIVFYGSSELFFWSAAMLAEFGRLRPSNALNFALLRAAAQRGMSWYNLGSSEGLPGVAKFKDNLGARDIAYHEIVLERARFKLYINVRRALAKRIPQRA